MLIYPDTSPVIFSIGPLDIHWYGLMYLIGFVGGWALGRYRASRPDSNWTAQQVDDLLFYIGLGVVLGGRLGYMLFYGLPGFISHPLSIFNLQGGGMSFHGGFMGVLFAMWLFQRKYHKSFFQVTDFIAPLIPLGLGAGRIGNFINGELWGKFTDLPWGVALPCARFPSYCTSSDLAQWSQPVHPSQLYEAGLEGLCLFIILWWFSAKPRPVGTVSALFLLCYGLFRFMVEFVRLPDVQLGYLAFGWFTMGQLLTLPMIIAGVILMMVSLRRKKMA